jgi:hypothetical protein
MQASDQGKIVRCERDGIAIGLRPLARMVGIVNPKITFDERVARRCGHVLSIPGDAWEDGARLPLGASLRSLGFRACLVIVACPVGSMAAPFSLAIQKLAAAHNKKPRPCGPGF